MKRITSIVLLVMVFVLVAGFPVDAQSGDNNRTFHGDVQGHPTAVNFHSLPPNQTPIPYPYLGVVVLASDMTMPKGQSEAGLTADLSAKLTEAQAFWEEASYGMVDMSYTVYPQVVVLPQPLTAYILRARPKILEGYGVSFPVTFSGGETLDIEGSANFKVTVTFPAGVMGNRNIVDTINTAIDQVPYNGPKEEKPYAWVKVDTDQIRISTAENVDPGVVLNITGGTAADLLGLGKNDITVYEGSTTQTLHLDLMMRDALRAITSQESDPAAYLRQFYGVAVAVASNLGWYTLRAEASLGPAEIDVLDNQKPFVIAKCYATTSNSGDTYAHEFGHTIGLPDLYKSEWRNVGAEVHLWDTMDSNSFSHPTSWIKAYQSNPDVAALRWTADSTVEVLNSDHQSLEVLLIPNESPFPAVNPYATSYPGVPLAHAIRIELSSNHFFYVENRQPGPYSDANLGTVNFSQAIPGSGLLITDAVNDVAPTHLNRAHVVLVPPYDLKLAHIPNSVIDALVAATTKAEKQAILAPYVPSEIPQNTADQISDLKYSSTLRKQIEDILQDYQDGQVYWFYPVNTVRDEVVLYQFPDGGGDIRVSITEVIGSQRPYVYKVKATWGHVGSWYDLTIRKWQSPPPYETPDIWIDSEENGWNVYLHQDANLNPDVPGNPVLNGDRPWVGHENRVYARVCNPGDMAQNNVRVDFRAVVPPGWADGVPVGVDYINVPAQGCAIAETLWTPGSTPADEHGCIEVQVEYRSDELNADNNIAQENITDFYAEKGSPYSLITVPFQFANPISEPVEMKVEPRGLIPGWNMTVEPYTLVLEPGEIFTGEVTLEAKDWVSLEHPEDYPVPIISLEALIHIGGTWEPIGGFSMIAHTVLKTNIDAAVDPTDEGMHVVAFAMTKQGDAVANANVAMLLTDPSGETIALAYATTDSDGRANAYITVDAEQYPHGMPLDLVVLLSPSDGVGPAQTRIPISNW